MNINKRATITRPVIVDVNQHIYDQGYAVSGPVHDDTRTFVHGKESIDIPSHHIMIELLDGREVADINRVREIAELYKTERV